jgi:hypothetical protein
MRCRGLQDVAEAVYLSGYLYLGLPYVAQYCVYRVTLSSTSSTFQSRSGKHCPMRLTGEPQPAALEHPPFK